MRWLKTTTVSSPTALEARSPNSWGRQGHSLCEGSRAGSLPTSSSFWRLLLFLGWDCISASIFTSSATLCPLFIEGCPSLYLEGTGQPTALPFVFPVYLTGAPRTQTPHSGGPDPPGSSPLFSQVPLPIAPTSSHPQARGDQWTPSDLSSPLLPLAL